MNVHKGDILQNSSSGLLWEIKSVQEDKKTVGLGNPDDDLGACVRADFMSLLRNYTMWRPAELAQVSEPEPEKESVNGFRVDDIVEVIYGYSWNGRGKVTSIYPVSNSFPHHVSVLLLDGSMEGQTGAFHTLLDIRHVEEKKSVPAKDVRVGDYIYIPDPWAGASDNGWQKRIIQIAHSEKDDKLHVVLTYNTVFGWLEMDGETMVELGDGND